MKSNLSWSFLPFFMWASFGACLIPLHVAHAGPKKLKLCVHKETGSISAKRRCKKKKEDTLSSDNLGSVTSISQTIEQIENKLTTESNSNASVLADLTSRVEALEAQVSSNATTLNSNTTSIASLSSSIVSLSDSTPIIYLLDVIQDGTLVNSNSDGVSSENIGSAYYKLTFPQDITNCYKFASKRRDTDLATDITTDFSFSPVMNEPNSTRVLLYRSASTAAPAPGAFYAVVLCMP